MTASTPEEQRIALFIDFENIAIGVRDAHYRRFDINLVIERLVEKGKILAKRAYADWGRYGEYRRSFHEAAVELIEVPQKSVGGKNSADIRLVVDAMDMSFQKEHIDCFCIASGDSDFSPLVSKLKENDKYVIGLGVKNSTSDLLMENCDEFIFYEDLVRRQEKPAVVIPNIPDKLQEAFSILVDSVVALQLENKGALWGSMVKETMKRKKPSFNETYYGFRSFSSLLEDAQRRGVVTMRRDQKSGSYIVEDLGPAARGDGAIVMPRPSETEAVVASANNNGSTPTPPPAAPAAAPSTSASTSASPAAPTAPTVASPTASASVAASTPAPSTPTSGDDEVEAESPDGEAPTRPRRRRGGRGRGRGRDGRRASGERDSQPDLEGVAEEPSLPSLDEDSNPSIPTPPQAAAAYAEVVERMSATDAPVFVETAPAAAAAAPHRVRAPRERHPRERKAEAAVAAPAPSPAPEAPTTPATDAVVDQYGRWQPQPESPTVAEAVKVAVAPEASKPTPVEPPAPTIASAPLEAEAPVDPIGAPADETPVVAPAPVVAAPPAPAAPTGPKPTPPVTPVDPTKASFSLLGWLKGGG